MKNSSIFGRKTLCLITGASRGIGESIAKNFAAKLASDSKLILLARNKENLELVRFDIISLNPTLSVDTVSCDLSQPNAKEYESILSNFQHSQFEVFMIVHNAATLGDISRKLSTITDVESVREYFDANVVSCLILNNIFLKLFPSSSSNLHVIVNISSGAAHSSKNGLHLYGTGKAARDAIFRGIAQESPQLRVLTYSPGPVATDMQKDLAENAYDEELKAWSHDGVQNKKFLTPDECVQPLLELLETNTFQSGEFVDVQNRHFRVMVS